MKKTDDERVEFSREQLAKMESTYRALHTALKQEQTAHATAMSIVAAANRALEEAATDLEGRARAIRGLLKQISALPKRKTTKRR